MSYDRCRTLVDRILDDGHLNPAIEKVPGPNPGVQGVCRVQDGELTAKRVTIDGATFHSLAYTDSTEDKSTIVTDSRTEDFGANIGHDRWADDGEAFLAWAEGLR